MDIWNEVIRQAEEFFNSHDTFYNGWEDCIYHLNCESFVRKNPFGFTDVIEINDRACLPAGFDDGKMGFIIEEYYELDGHDQTRRHPDDYIFPDNVLKQLKQMYRKRKRDLARGITITF